ncbi:MAG: L-lactate permease [Chloroflexi bacterium OHK40]
MLDPILAALPIVLILGLMLGLGWPAARAGAAGLVVALAQAWLVFARTGTAYGELGPPTATAGALAEALFTAATILWIIFPALAIHQLQTRTGGIEVLRGVLGQLTPDPRLAAAIVAWFFALFIEGAAGFGTTIALAAPLLTGLGLSPVAALSAALLGHAVGVSFGAVGTPVLPQVAATGLAPLELARTTGLFHALLGWIMLLFTVGVIRGELTSVKNERPIGGTMLAAAVLFLAPMLAIAWFVGPELPTLGGALTGGLGFVALLRLRGASSGGTIDGKALARAAAPYLALIGLVLATRLIGPLRNALVAVELAWSWHDTFQGSFQPLYHPGTMLLLSFALGALWQQPPANAVWAALGAAARQLGGVAMALIAMLGLSRVLVQAGMIDTLAQATAVGVGGAWPLVAPFIGVLGTFVTGSATASNILFTDFQRVTTEDIGLPVLIIVAAQGFGAAVGNIICPHNIIAGGATVGLSGEVGPVLRRTLLACLLYAALGGVLALALTWLLPAG